MFLELRDLELWMMAHAGADAIAKRAASAAFRSLKDYLESLEERIVRLEQKERDRG